MQTLLVIGDLHPWTRPRRADSAGSAVDSGVKAFDIDGGSVFFEKYFDELRSFIKGRVKEKQSLLDYHHILPLIYFHILSTYLV